MIDSSKSDHQSGGFRYDGLSETARNDLAKRVARELASSGTHQEETSGSRRDVLKLLGATGVGAAGGVVSQPARANPDNRDIGGENDPVDVYASNIHGPHGSVDFQAPIKANKLTSGTVNGIAYVAPGDSIQAAIDAVAKNQGAVALHPGGTYNEGTEIHLKKGVTLLGNGAEIKITADHNGIFVDNHAQILNYPFIQADFEGYSSNCVVLDTKRCANGNYGWAKKRRHVQLDFQAQILKNSGSPLITPGSSCLELRGDGAGISWVRGNIQLNGGERVFHVYSESGFVNANHFNAFISGGINQLHHSGSSGNNTTVCGVLQTGYDVTKHHFVSDSSTVRGRSWQFFGDIWDTGHLPSDGSPVKGYFINLFLMTQRNIGAMRSKQDPSLNCRGSTAVAISDRGGLQWLELDTARVYDMTTHWKNGDIRWSVTEPSGTTNDLMKLDRSGNLWVKGSVKQL